MKAEASEAIVGAAFAAGAGRLTAMTFPDNEAALHILEKLDFVPAGETTFEAVGTPSSSGSVSVPACPPARAAPA